MHHMVLISLGLTFIVFALDYLVLYLFKKRIQAIAEEV